MFRSIVLAAAAGAVIHGLPAAAQEVECDVKKACSTSHIEYDPGNGEGFAVFGNVTVYFDGHQVSKLTDSSLDAVDIVDVDIGSCKMNILQPHTPFPRPDDNPDVRRTLAREEADRIVADLKGTASVISVDGPELTTNEPGFAQYQVTSRWLGYLGKGNLYEVRRVTVGYYQMVEKWCKAPSAEAAQQLYDEHRIAIRKTPVS
jgi:hypothetical protein